MSIPVFPDLIQQNDQTEARAKHLEELREKDIVIADYDELLEKEQAGVRAYYLQNIFPLVTPQAMDPAHPFPFVS